MWKRPTAFVLAGLTLAGVWATAWAAEPDTAPATQPAATQPGTDISTGWTLLKEGEAEGTMEQDAKHPANPSPHLLRIAVTKTAAPGKGRAGATNSTLIPVEDDHWYDITFTAVTERGSIGLGFPWKPPTAKCWLARRCPKSAGAAADAAVMAGQRLLPAPGPTGRKYLVSLHTRAANPQAHVVITPIEPTNIWLDGLTLTPRKTTP